MVSKRLQKQTPNNFSYPNPLRWVGFFFASPLLPLCKVAEIRKATTPLSLQVNLFFLSRTQKKVLDISHRILYIKLNLTKGKNDMTNLTEAYLYAQSNGVDLNREIAMEELFKTKLGDFMDAVSYTHLTLPTKRIV